MGSTDPLAWLWPAPGEPVTTLADGTAEASGYVRDGLVAEVWPGVLVARDLGAGRATRIGVLRPLLPAGSVVVRRSALWVLTGMGPPSRVDAVLQGPRRRSTPLVAFHADRLAPEDVWACGPVLLTTPARTAVDLARHGDDDALGDALPRLVEQGLTRGELDVVLDRLAGRPGVGTARRALAGLMRDDRLPAPSLRGGKGDS